MIPLSEWTCACPLPDRPWLILGKGPTFAVRGHFDLGQFNLISLNHVVREQRVDIAHFIDLDALGQCADILPTQADWLMVPLYPHVDFQPTERSLFELLRTTCHSERSDESAEAVKDASRFLAPLGMTDKGGALQSAAVILRCFAQRRRLVWYYHDLVSRPDLKERYPPDAWPIIRVDAFSAEAVVNILAALGAKKVRTLGIDGGSHYAGAFHDLNGVTRLANGQSSFDRQFIGIHRTAKETGMDYGPLTEPIRVYVGTDETQMVAVQVLEYSIRRFATRPVDVVPMLNLPVPIPKDPANRPRTGFSFARFLIPSLAGYRGKAIYLDADMLVFGDIADLWDTPLDGAKALCTRQDAPPITWQNNAHFQPGRQMSVMLIDCERCHWKIDEIVRGLDEARYDYRRLMCDLCILAPEEIGEHLDPMWNCLEHFEAGRTKLLHFTDMDMQPWRHRHNPLKSIWRAYFRAAVEAGAVDPALVEKGIAGGWLVPELADDLRFAPARMAGDPPSAALAGTPSVRQRSLELEATALRAELGLVRLEAELLRHECHKQFLEVQRVEADRAHVAADRAHVAADRAHIEANLRTMQTYAADLENQVRSLSLLPAKIEELHEQIAKLNADLTAAYGSWTWSIGRAITRPADTVRKLRRSA